MRLIIFHYHLRPGGIRRIIELATPHIVRSYEGALEEVVLATGEANDSKWNELFRKQISGTRVTFFTDPSLGYISDQKGSPDVLTRKIQRALQRLFAPSPNQCVGWAHNPGIARNLLLTRELNSFCDRHGVPLIAHHHDWWFENRWLRWPEIQACGFRSLAAAARAVFPRSGQVRHCTINPSDAGILKPHIPNVTWIPNLTEPEAPPGAHRVRLARRWLGEQLDDKRAPIWILPCRLLRRKNIAEALLLKRLVRPEAWLITTGAPSSQDELPYARKLASAAEKHGWRVRLSILKDAKGAPPSIPEMLAASECVLLTSIQEGFGLPYLEAAAAQRPLIARELPNIAPDLRKFGFRFPQYYRELLVPLHLFDAEEETARQAALFTQWKRQMPRNCRAWAGEPLFVSAVRAGQPVPFSRLTLTAQIEILRHDRATLWTSCEKLNPFLADWAHRASEGKLDAAPWPDRANDWLSGHAYAHRWQRVLNSTPRHRPSSKDAVAAQTQFIQTKLKPEYLYPLLWARET